MIFTSEGMNRESKSFSNNLSIWANDSSFRSDMVVDHVSCVQKLDFGITCSSINDTTLCCMVFSA